MASRSLVRKTLSLSQQMRPFVQGSRQLQTSTTVCSSRKADDLMASLAQAQLDDLIKQGINFPMRVRTHEHNETVRLVETGDQDILDFSKNSYLGLGCHPAIIQAAHEALDEFGVGIGNVRAGHGTFTPHKQLEAQLTDFLERDPEKFETMVFPTGYHANLALFHIMCGPEDIIISDRLIHGTAIHGMTLSRAERTIFNHNDMEDLERKLAANMDKRQRVIAADGIYSMHGMCAKLKEMRILADKYDALLMIDDAHGMGIIGEYGKGAEEYAGAMNSCDVITGSLCKGLTPAGGFLVARKPLLEMLKLRSGSYVFSTALTPSNTAAVMKALEIARGEEGYKRRTEIRRLSKLFRELMTKENFFVDGLEDMPICPVVFRNDQPFTLQWAQILLVEHDILTLGVPLPSAPADAPRIRVVIAGFHTEAHVRRLVDAFVAIGKKFNRTQ